ncbi:uncharacterized protein LOC132706626 [Cylas formicarius]|uniref:uncharacterized protein LOC132706626 n=1 Tax=Cylas formicarius TaxID=197179 RepID=UPI00295895D8|nr:uncharacterized protein LOC132706626 [Cylas formicarius]
MAAGTKRHPSILTFARYSMSSVGFWKYPNQKYPLKLFYHFYSAFFIFYYVTYTVSACTQFTITLTAASAFDSAMIKQLSFVITILISFYVIMVCHSKTFNKNISHIVREERSMLQSDDADVIKFHLQQIRNCNAMNAIVSILAFGTGFAMALENYLINVKVARYNKDHNTTLERPLLIDLYYFKIDKHKRCDLLLVFAEMSFAFNTLIMLSPKLSIYACVIFTSSLLKQLQIRFSKLGLGREDTLTSLKHLVREHQKIIAFVIQLNASMKFLILLEYLLNSLNVAAVSVQFITYEKKMLLMPCFYIFFLLVQVFTMGISANEIKAQSLALSDAIYSSPWQEQNESVKKILLIVIGRTQRPLMLTIGPFGPMVIDSALAICKASYSYVTLMMHNVQ